MKSKTVTTEFWIVLFCLLCLPAVAVAAGEQAPKNPEYIRYTKTATHKTSSGLALGYRPSPLDLSHVEPPGGLFPSPKSARELPATFDLRPHFVTGMRDQNPYGTCWAFACFASLESTFKKRSLRSYDFSEWHLAYFAYVDENPAFPAFTARSLPDFGSDPIFDQGGHAWMTTALLARGTGAISETRRPYQNLFPWPPASRPLSTDPVARSLVHVFYLGNDVDEIVTKNTLMIYGAMAVRVVWDNDAFNNTTNAYYNAEGGGGGHLVTIVGWDDNFPATSFAPHAQHNGAWLVKNSWGTGWGDQGYFWLAYEDPTISSPSLFIGSDTKTFDRIHQYDPLGWTDSYGFRDETAWFANIFTASGAQGGRQPEYLQAVSLYSGAAESTYRMEIWTEVEANNPRSGALSLELEGTLSAAGYHTVRLPWPVELPAGEKFAVVIRITTPGYDFPIPMENPLPEYSEKAVALSGQSFASPDGQQWNDMTHLVPNANVCVKAFTTDWPSTGESGGGCSVSGSVDLLPAFLILALPVLALLRGLRVVQHV